MRYAQIKKKAHSLLDEASWLAHIKDDNDYEMAIRLMDELVEDYELNLPLIEILSASIERWENEDKAFADFNEKVNNLNQGVSLLNVLMTQHKLGIADLPELGSKSLVSKILNGHRKLTYDHIYALANRFNISPALFFPL